METLKQLLLDYVNSQENWVTKGQCYILAEQHEYSPENAGRRLRELAEEGKIQVDHYKGKRGQTLTKYAKIDVPKSTKPKIEIRDGTAFIIN